MRRGPSILSFCLLCLTAPVYAGAIGSGPFQHIDSLKLADKAILIQHAKHPSFPSVLERARRDGVDVSVAKHFQSVPQIFSNAAVYYLRMAQDDQFAVDPVEKSALQLIDTPVLTDDQWQATTAFLSSHKNLMVMAHAAASYAKCIVPREDDGAQPISWQFPELTSCRRVACLLTLESLVLAHEGKFPEAVKNEGLCFLVADHAASDITMVAWMVAVAVDHIGLKGLQSILTMSKGDAAVAGEVDTVVAAKWHPRRMSSAFKTEDAQMIAQVEYWQGLTPAQLVQDTGGSPTLLVPDQATVRALMDVMGSRLIADEVSMVEIADQPYPRASKQIRAITDRATHCKTFDATLSRFVLPVMIPFTDSVAGDTAFAAVTRAACAVFVYKSTHGTYPSTLADATSTAIDPFDGKALRYRRTAKGFVVYSVGPTGKYDGGDFDSKKQHEEVFRYSNNEQ